MALIQRYFILLAVCVQFLLLHGVALAAPRPEDPNISVDFDRTAIIKGEPFRMVITVETVSQDEPRVTLPSLNDFEVIDKDVRTPRMGARAFFQFGTGRAGQRQSTQEITRQYIFILKAPKAGKFTLQPVQVKMDGFTFKGDLNHIEVFDHGDASANAPDTFSPGVPGGNTLTSEQLKGARLDKRYFVHMIPSKNKVYKGEPIVLDVYLFAAVSNVVKYWYKTEPGLKGFWVEKLDDFDHRNYRNKMIEINGTVYEQILLDKKVIFPHRDGQLQVTPATISILIGQMGLLGLRGGGQEVDLTSAPVSVEVMPLPENGKPADFNELNVGRYSLFVNASSTSVKAGDPVTLTISVKGQGNLRNVALPQLPELPGVKLYTPEENVQVKAAQSTISGVSQRKLALIPDKEGTLTIPSLEWSYFDYGKANYVTERSDAVQIEVLPGKSSGAQVAVTASPSVDLSASGQGEVSGAVARMNAKLRTIENNVDISVSGPPVFGRTWFVILVASFPLFYAIYLVVLWWRRKRADDQVKHRSKGAARRATKELNRLFAERQLSNEQFFSRLHRVLVTFLEERLEDTVKGDTKLQLRDKLEHRGLEERQIDAIVECLDEYEFARFARGDSEGGGREAHKGRLVELIAKVDAAGIIPVESRTGFRTDSRAGTSDARGGEV